MKQSNPTNFARLAAQMLFVAGLLLVVTGPQLASPRPEGIFRDIKGIFGSFSIPAMAVIGGVAGFGALALGNARRQRLAKAAAAAAAKSFGGKSAETRAGIWDMPITDAVSPTHGGNGLASAPLPLPFAAISGFITVQTPGMECVVLDGKKVIEKSRIVWAPMRIIGKKTFARRVLLRPKPQSIPTIEALSHDKWSAKVDATVTYRVTDPVRALSESPTSELNHLVQGIVAEHIRANDLRDLLSDIGVLRGELEQRLRKSFTLDGFEIVEVPLPSIKGDERYFEIERQKKLAEQESGLIKQVGENKVLAAGFEVQVKAMNEQLNEAMKQRDHARTLELLRANLQGSNLLGTIEMIREIGKGGGDIKGAIAALQMIVGGEALGALPAPKAQPAPSPNDEFAESPLDARLSAERQLLDDKRQFIGFTSYDMRPYSKNASQRIVEFTFPSFRIVALCMENYPEEPPQMVAVFGESDRKRIHIPWEPGSTLVNAIAATVMQLPQYQPSA